MQHVDDSGFTRGGDDSFSRVGLNRGRPYDCGRVPPLPKQKRASKKHGVDNSDSSNNANHPSPFTLLSFLKGSHTNRRKNAFSESGWRRRIERGQISVDGVIVRDPEYVLSKAKQQVEYHRLPWKEPILRVVVNDDEEEGNGSTKGGIQIHDDETTLKILYIDDHLMVVHKPSGLPTMPSQTYFEYSVLSALRRLFDEKTESDNNTPTNVFATPGAKELIRSHCTVQPQPVHRLGVGTSGVLVVATSLLGRQRLTDAIRLKSNNMGSGGTAIRKVYRALVYSRRCDDRPGNGKLDMNSNFDDDGFPRKRDGPVIPELFTIDCPIGLVPFPIGGDSIHAACPCDSASLYSHVHTKKSQSTISESDRRGNGVDADVDRSKSKSNKTRSTTKSAVSHVRVICRKNVETTTTMEEAAVVEVEIPTGRPHQIRIHMAYAGYSLVGDPLYLPGGIPNLLPRAFESLQKEEEDMETDDENDSESANNIEEKEGSLETNCTKKRYIKRVALPRDCGYHLHAHSITLEHPFGAPSTKAVDSSVYLNSSNIPPTSTMTFIAPPPAILRE